jgi:transcription factor IIIB subunit 2
MNYGSILTEAILVNKINFTELADGTSIRVGQVVMAPTRGQNYATSTHTSMQGKAQISAICRQLPRLENQPDVVLRAERIFSAGFQYRFVRSRTIEIVAAASVYIAIGPTATTGYLLVDMADNLSCGVFELAATALRLSKTVGEEMPVLDPTLYIDRFTDELDFGQQTSEIKETALHIIRRLDHDWIQTRRKPVGVCGAHSWTPGAERDHSEVLARLYLDNK